ncbi:MAG TPA: response regulator transcription factor [Kofleriaceae bacterium]|nr:response regulator transcription factor [Kofleriaceae bacterium]
MRRAFLVEDSEPVRTGIATLLARDGRYAIVACCANVSEARAALASNVEVDVALIDLRLPDGSGLEVIAELAAARPRAHILVLTKFADPDEIVAAMRAGAVGYLLKHTPRGRILQALDEAELGGAPMSPEIARKLVESLRPRTARGDAGLTNREHDVLLGLARGLRYREIAAELGMGESTVQTHVKSIYKKLRVTTKAAATREALRRRLVD